MQHYHGDGIGFRGEETREVDGEISLLVLDGYSPVVVGIDMLFRSAPVPKVRPRQCKFRDSRTGDSTYQSKSIQAAFASVSH